MEPDMACGVVGKVCDWLLVYSTMYMYIVLYAYFTNNSQK